MDVLAAPDPTEEREALLADDSLVHAHRGYREITGKLNFQVSNHRNQGVLYH